MFQLKSKEKALKGGVDRADHGLGTGCVLGKGTWMRGEPELRSACAPLPKLCIGLSEWVCISLEERVPFSHGGPPQAPSSPGSHRGYEEGKPGLGL